jgi:hypothetical protein
MPTFIAAIIVGAVRALVAVAAIQWFGRRYARCEHVLVDCAAS